MSVVKKEIPFNERIGEGIKNAARGAGGGLTRCTMSEVL